MMNTSRFKVSYKRKINNVWADDHTFKLVSEVLLKAQKIINLI